MTLSEALLITSALGARRCEVFGLGSLKRLGWSKSMAIGLERPGCFKELW